MLNALAVIVPKTGSRYLEMTKIARSALRLGSSLTSVPASVSRAMQRWMRMPFSRQKSSKSAMREEADVGRVVPLVAAAGPAVSGARPCSASMLPQLVVGEVREADDALPPDAEHVVEHAARTSRTAWSVCESTTKSNCPSANCARPVVQVGLDHVEPAADAGDDRLLVQLEAHEPLVPAPCSRASSPPVPQPRSSTLAAGGISSTIGRSRAAGGGRCSWGCRPSAGVVVGSRWPAGRAAVRFGQERPHQLAVDGQVVGQQEGVVAAVAGDVAVADRLVGGDQGVDDLLRLDGGNSQSLVKLTTSQRHVLAGQAAGQLLRACRPGRTGPSPSSA